MEYYMSKLVLLLNLCLCTPIFLLVKESVIERNKLYCFNKNPTQLLSSSGFALLVLFQFCRVYVLFFPLSFADSFAFPSSWTIERAVPLI